MSDDERRARNHASGRREREAAIKAAQERLVPMDIDATTSTNDQVTISTEDTLVTHGDAANGVEPTTTQVENVLGSVEDNIDEGGPLQKYKKRKKPKLPDLRVANEISVSGPFPGGPTNATLLKSFYDHVALRIHLGQERDPLKLIHHDTQLQGWKIPEGCQYFRNRLNATGLQALVNGLPQLNKVLVSAFVERWHPETSSFHLPFGEMTITLDDVQQISGLSVEGQLLKQMEIKDIETAIDLLKRTLGLEEGVIRDELRAHDFNFVVKMSWIQEMLKGKEELAIPETDAGKKVVDCCVRGYLLFMLGCSLFCEKSGALVHIHYLKYLEDLDAVSTYAWGASGLAYLYKTLGDASKFKTAQINGYLSLLEVWIYEHFPNFNGVLNRDYNERQPRMLRWHKFGRTNNPAHGVVMCRQQLDMMDENQVIFDPYVEQRSTTRPIAPITFYEGLLSSMWAVAPHMPNRVLRQFGLRQIIPCDPADMQGNYFLQWSSHVFDPEKREKLVEGGSSCVDGYMGWYLAHSHPKVQEVSKWVGSKVATTTRSVSVDGNHYKALYEKLLLHCKNVEKIIGEIVDLPKRTHGKHGPKLITCREELKLGISYAAEVEEQEDDEAEVEEQEEDEEDATEVEEQEEDEEEDEVTRHRAVSRSGTPSQGTQSQTHQWHTPSRRPRMKSVTMPKKKKFVKR